jgi:hypothetical protein
MLTLQAIPAWGASTATTARLRPRAARLQGFFRLSGVITVADHVGSERAGERITRIWAFHPLCAAGACARVELVRIRRYARDRVILRRVAPAYYVGQGRFYAPLRCGGRIFPHGESVPFVVSVRVTAAARSHGGVVATHLRAQYTNRSRTNLTPCVGILGHDAAVYSGYHLTTPLAHANGEIRSVASTRSSTSS